MLKKLINITCHKATYLSSKKEEGKATFLENVQLKMHHAICNGCKLFATQTAYIGKNASQAHQFSKAVLSDASLNKMKKMIGF